MRLALAVVTGYVVFAISAVLLFQLTQQDPQATPSLNFAIASVVWGMVFAALGGFVASRIAQRADWMAGLVLGGVIAAGAASSMLLQPGEGSYWSQLSALLLMAPCAWAGGLIKRRKLSRDTTSAG